MSYESEDKMVSHPSHYKFGNFEVIDVVDAVTEELSGYECNYTAQALQYLMRWHRKNGYQDLEKAIWFIQRILDKHKEEGRETDVKNDETLYSLKKPEINDGNECCANCANYAPGETDGFGTCVHSIYSDDSVHDNCWCSNYERKPGIDDEPKPLGLRKNAAGVYIPHDPEREIRSCKNCDYGYISSIKDCTYGPCVGHPGNHNVSVGFNCKRWELKEEER